MHRHTRRLLFALLLLFAPAACRPQGLRLPPTPMPPATHVAAAPLPAGPAVGGLEGTFMALDSYAGAGGRQCYRLLRFYADGVAVDGTGCFLPDAAAILDAEQAAAWLHQDNPDLGLGDYVRNPGADTHEPSAAEDREDERSQDRHDAPRNSIPSPYGDRIVLRLVHYDILARAPAVETWTGYVCGPRLLLQPAELAPAPVGARGVQEFRRLAEPQGDLGEPSFLPPVGTAAGACALPGFRFLFRSDITLQGGLGRYEIQTEPQQACYLHYMPPDGIARGETVMARADAGGVCRVVWEVGDTAGTGVVTVTIGPVTQPFTIVVSESRARPNLGGDTP